MFVSVAFIITFYVYECLSVCVLHALLVPREARRESQVPWNWSYRCFWATIWVLISSARALSSLSCWAINLEAFFFLLITTIYRDLGTNSLYFNKLCLYSKMVVILHILICKEVSAELRWVEVFIILPD